MSYNLVIDQGNSTAKVAVFEGDSLVEQWRCEELLPEVLRRVAASTPIDAAIYCSVTHHSENIVVTLRELAGKVYELTSLLPLPITLGYATPSSLGRDRIAAVAGARAMLPGRTVLVVDAGTAITYDLLLPDGTFPGGNIAPGLWLRAESLNRHTERLPLVNVETPGDVPLWGTDTPRAITAGVVRGVAGEIDYYRSLLPADAAVVLTGGDAVRLAPFVPQHPAAEVIVEPALVSRGLNHILQYNLSLKEQNQSLPQT
ncbi:type III pantothenate kinase [uncultured Muribaculum sp.]|uniref:type III pantothenate kinase n=1 Tax=uncultured Muribaculum sp. TaxID=1918613 RepID=UPI0025D07CD7|nr:type III pantothenate kinase [uncultured Muribaculum sp.]